MSTPHGGESILTDALFFVDEMAKTVDELALEALMEVIELRKSYENSHPDSGATLAELQGAAYFAKSVEDPEKFPPLSEEMKAEVENWQLTDKIVQNLREASGKSPDLSPEEQQLQMEERMQAHMIYQNQMSI
jgi:hypothetical protein